MPLVPGKWDSALILRQSRLGIGGRPTDGRPHVIARCGPRTSRFGEPQRGWERPSLRRPIRSFTFRSMSGGNVAVSRPSTLTTLNGRLLIR